MGGLAVWLTSPSVRQPPYARSYRDMDFVALSRDTQQLRTFLDEQGYEPDRLFNAIHGAQRLIFQARAAAWSIDVILDELRMSHRLDLRDRLTGPRSTLPLADLLLTKLQVWEVNEKDLGDALCLLVDHPLAGDGRDGTAGRSGVDASEGQGPVEAVEAIEAIDLARLRAVLGADWGLCHTVERNLGRLAELGRAKPPTGARFDSTAQVDALLSAIASAPKSIGWRARAQVGERVRWYETPEEVRR